jgi:hypothetical protein
MEGGPQGHVALELAALGRYAEIERFFRQAALSHRLVDVETLTLAATPEDVIKLTATLKLPFRPLRATLPAPPEGLRPKLTGVPRPLADAFLRDQALAVAKSETIAALRRSRRNPRLFLSELAAAVRDRPVVLSYATLGEEFVVRGLAVGEGPVRGLEARLERGFFRLAEFLVARQGGCHRFEVRGASPIVGLDAEIPLTTEDPFRQDDAPCRVDRDAGSTMTLRLPQPKAPAKGGLSLRLRDVDVADVFLVLHLLSGEPFVVDGDVVGRVSLDLSRVTLEEALALLEKTGLRVSPSGPIRRVQRARANGTPAPRPAAPPGAATASFTLKRADVRDVLAVMAESDPALGALGPQGFLGRVSLWARDAPLFDVRAIVLEAAGLAERIEEGRRILERTPGSNEAVFPVAATPADRRLVLKPQDLAVLEFELAGLASAGEHWLALAYSPTGALNVYRAGERLADGSVKSVESTDVLLETEEGALRVPLAALPH